MLSVKWVTSACWRGHSPWWVQVGSLAFPCTYTLTEAEEEEEGKEAAGRKSPRHTRGRVKVQERMKAAGRWLKSFCLAL